MLAPAFELSLSGRNLTEAVVKKSQRLQGVGFFRCASAGETEAARDSSGQEHSAVSVSTAADRAAFKSKNLNMALHTPSFIWGEQKIVAI